MKQYIVTDADGEYEPTLFSTAKRAQYWIDTAGEEGVDYEISECIADETLDEEELEAADAIEDLVEEEA